jgi:hypothetical protein
MTAAAAVVAFVAGCSKSSHETAEPTTTDKAAATAALWDPCTQLGNDVLEKLGVDQSSKESGIGGVPQSGWKICTWFYPPAHERSVVVYSTTYTVDDFKKKADNTDFVNISVNGRDGWRFHRISDKNNDVCDLVFAGASGAYEISFNNLDPSVTVSPCDEAVSAANIIVPILPR